MVKIHNASPQQPILTRYEPNFRRFYAKGGLVSKNGEPDDGLIHLAFWSSKQEVQIEDEVTGTGYALEAEVTLTRDAAERLKGLLEHWLSSNEP